jgi:hypothetical protein
MLLILPGIEPSMTAAENGSSFGERLHGNEHQVGQAGLSWMAISPSRTTSQPLAASFGKEPLTMRVRILWLGCATS